MDARAKVFVAGHRGLVGSAIVRGLRAQGYENLLLKTRQELNLMDADAVANFFSTERPEFVFLAAAKVGGILANSTRPADFIHENLSVQTNVLWNAHRFGVEKLLFLGSSCIYPKFAPQPIREDALLTGELEPSNKAYAVAKIAGIIACQAFNEQYGTRFISAMPTNLYGPNDNFDLQTSHVLPALIRRFHEAKLRGDSEVRVWGSGRARREFLHADDCADACIFLMREYEDSKIINVGTGSDIEIRELAELIRDIVGFKGSITWDPEKPDGTPQKCLDVSKIHALGWRHRIGLREGLQRTYDWYTTSVNNDDAHHRP